MKKLWIITAAGILLRVFLSLITFHPDIQVFNMAGKTIASGSILNLYDFSSNLGVLNYPPLIYLYHGVFNFLFGTILHLPQMNQFLLNSSPSFGNFAFNINLLLLKIPYLIFDLLAGYILFKLFEQKNRGKLAFTLWMFNPISLYATYMMGQFDIIPTFFIVLSVYFVARGKLSFAALALGGGIAFKLSPIFLVIPLMIFGKNKTERLKLLFLAIVPYLITILPYIGSHSFRTTALFANQSAKSLYANMPVSGGESIILFPAALLLFYLIIWGSRLRMDIYKLYLIPLLLFFIFTHYHPQWLIWITPLLVLELLSSGFKTSLTVALIFISWFASLFFFDPSLTVNIFAPIDPILRNMPSVWSILNINIDYNFTRSIIQTIFAAASIYLIYLYFSVRENE